MMVLLLEHKSSQQKRIEVLKSENNKLRAEIQKTSLDERNQQSFNTKEQKDSMLNVLEQVQKEPNQLLVQVEDMNSKIEKLGRQKEELIEEEEKLVKEKGVLLQEYE